MEEKIFELQSDIPGGFLEIAKVVAKQYKIIKSGVNTIFQIPHPLIRDLYRLKVYVEEGLISKINEVYILYGQPTTAEQLQKLQNSISIFSQDLRKIIAVENVYAILPIKVFNVIKDFHLLIYRKDNLILYWEGIQDRINFFQEQFFQVNESQQQANITSIKYMSFLKGIVYFLCVVAFKFKDPKILNEAIYFLQDAFGYVQEIARYLVIESYIYQTNEPEPLSLKIQKGIMDTPAATNIIHALGYYLQALIEACRNLISDQPLKNILEIVGTKSMGSYMNDKQCWYHSLMTTYFITSNVLGVFETFAPCKKEEKEEDQKIPGIQLNYEITDIDK